MDSAIRRREPVAVLNGKFPFITSRKKNNKYFNRYVCVHVCVMNNHILGKQKTLGAGESFVFSYCLFLFIWPWGIWNLSFLIRIKLSLCLGNEESQLPDLPEKSLSLLETTQFTFAWTALGGGLLLQRSSLCFPPREVLPKCSVEVPHIEVNSSAATL